MKNRERAAHAQRPIHPGIPKQNQGIPGRDKQQEADGGVIGHDGISLFICLRKMHNQVDPPAQGDKDNPVEAAASGARQDEGGKGREKGQDHEQESRQECEQMDG